MDDILSDLYYGEITPIAMEFRRGSEYGKALAEITRLSDEIRKLLGPEHVALMDQLSSAQLQTIDISERERFILGFRLGAKVMISVLTGESDTFKML